MGKKEEKVTPKLNKSTPKVEEFSWNPLNHWQLKLNLLKKLTLTQLREVLQLETGKMQIRVKEHIVERFGLDALTV